MSRAVENSQETSGQRSSAQYLTFALGKEEYAIEILRVQEIKGYSALTQIPNAPAFIRGVMNLRGAVVPVIDLRIKFGMPSAEIDRFTVIIIVKVRGKTVGLVVDSVSDVLDLLSADIEPTPDLGYHVDTSFMNGMAKNADRLIILLDIEKLLGGDVLSSVAESN